MLPSKQQVMVTALLCSAALHCNAVDYQTKPYVVKPAPQMSMPQPPTPPESQGLWPMERKEEVRRPTPNQTVRGRAKLYPQEEPMPRIKLGDPPQ